MIRNLLIRVVAIPVARVITMYRAVTDRTQLIAALQAAGRITQKQNDHIARLQNELQTMSIEKAQADADLARFRGEPEDMTG